MPRDYYGRSRPPTLTDIKAANKACGSHWFEPGSMRFFNTKIERRVHSGSGGTFFVTKERMDERFPFRYSVREATDGGCKISTVGEFQGYASASEAHRAAEALAKKET